MTDGYRVSIQSCLLRCKKGPAEHKSQGEKQNLFRTTISLHSELIIQQKQQIRKFNQLQTWGWMEEACFTSHGFPHTDTVIAGFHFLMSPIFFLAVHNMPAAYFPVLDQTLESLRFLPEWWNWCVFIAALRHPLTAELCQCGWVFWSKWSPWQMNEPP